MNTKPLTALTAVLALGACAAPPPPAPTVDLNVGISKLCEAPNVDLASGTATTTIRMSNDGWCSVAASDGGAPYVLGRVTVRPANGRIVVQSVGTDTRIEYTPNERFTGTDQFTVALRPRSASAPDVPVQVAVTVGAGEATAVNAPAIVAPPAAAAAPRPAARPAARTAAPARRPATR